MTPIWRALADGLINAAECQPRRSEAARFLREAAANLLDADSAFERQDSRSPNQRTGDQIR